MTTTETLPAQADVVIDQAESGFGFVQLGQRVVRDALRLMEEKDLLRATKLDQLRQEIQEGLSSGPVTAWDREEIKRKGRAKRATKMGTAKA